MYIFLLFIAVCLIAVPLYFYFENKKAAKLKQEKLEGKWDFIEMEYLPYLSSHEEPVHRIEKLSFKINYRSYWWSLTGDLQYNAAGIYIQFVNTNLPSSPQLIFIWGKDKPAKFCPSSELFFHSLEIKDSKVQLNLKTKAKRESSDYTLTIKGASQDLVSELKRVLTPLG